MSELYFVTDIETDGPIPGPYSMLSFASVVVDGNGNVTDRSFSANLERLRDSVQDPDTMAWWAQNQGAYEATRVDAADPHAVMVIYKNWIADICGPESKPVFVGYPAGFDFMFVYWYLMNFGGHSPFSFSAIDMKTMAMVLLRKSYRKVSKRSMPNRWFNPELNHTHIALDDAREQAFTFSQMLSDVEL